VTTTAARPKRDAGVGRSTARLAAVQALYQVAATDSDYTKVVRDFLAGRLGGMAINEDPDTEAETHVRLADMDQGMFSGLVREAIARQDDIDEMINANLSGDWPQDRLELIVRSILRAAIAELLGAIEAPAKVTISEYVDITHAFYSGTEPKMVNAVLDKIARVLHSKELPAS
jgi:transcription antitermination protein NusB